MNFSRFRNRQYLHWFVTHAYWMAQGLMKRPEDRDNEETWIIFPSYKESQEKKMQPTGFGLPKTRGTRAIVWGGGRKRVLPIPWPLPGRCPSANQTLCRHPALMTSPMSWSTKGGLLAPYFCHYFIIIILQRFTEWRETLYHLHYMRVIQC